MARTIRNAKIDTRSARAKLAQRREPYWTVVTAGCAVGYRKGVKGGSWIARWRGPNGDQQYRALGPADDAMEADRQTLLNYGHAQAAARAWFILAGRQAAGLEHLPTGPLTVSTALDEYLRWFARHKKSARDTTYTIETHIRPVLGTIEVGKLTTAKLRRWHEDLADRPARLRSKANAPARFRDAAVGADAVRARRASANRILTVLKAALNKAFQDGQVASDSAWRQVRPFRGVDAARLRYLSESECRRLLDACADDFRRLVRGALVSGCRYGELIRLVAADFNREAGSLLIRETKSGKSRHVPLDEGGCAFFDSLTVGQPAERLIFTGDSGKPWGKSHQARPLALACRAARLDPPANFHCLRHTWASHRVMKGAPLIVVAQVLGHADTRMVEKHYGHLAPSYIRDVVRATALDLGPDQADNAERFVELADTTCLQLEC